MRDGTAKEEIEKEVRCLAVVVCCIRYYQVRDLWPTSVSRFKNFLYFLPVRILPRFEQTYALYNTQYYSYATLFVA